MAAAKCSSNSVVQVAAMAAATLMMMMMMMMSTGSVASRVECPSGLVYPYWSTCWDPAKYFYYGGVYELAAVGAEGSLAPEWDETNSTYYVRLADEGAKYNFTHLTRETRFAVAQSDIVIIQNAESGRALGWRQEGEEYFLVELEIGSSFFQFSKADSAQVPLPCPRIANARCEAYYILNYGTSEGLTPYEEDGATYFKLGDSSNALPFVLTRSTSTTSSSSVDIKMATATA